MPVYQTRRRARPARRLSGLPVQSGGSPRFADWPRPPPVGLPKDDSFFLKKMMYTK